jgi:hypothetical protein
VPQARSATEFNIIPVDLHCPLCDLPYCFFALEDVRQWLIGNNPYGMSQEIMLQLPGHHEYYAERLLHLWVSFLSVFQNFTNKVYWLLFYFCVTFWPFNDGNCTNECVGGCDIE